MSQRPKTKVRRYVMEGAATENDPRKIAFAKNLNRFMLSKGWNQTELAHEAEKKLPASYIEKQKKAKRKRGSDTNGIFGRWNISNYLAGNTMPENIRIEALAKALGVTISDLVPPGSADIVGASISVTNTAKPDSMRVRIDMELPSLVAMKILELVNGAQNGEQK